MTAVSLSPCVPQDYAEALTWYRLAAGQGDINAQGNLGHMYAHGEGVRQDCAEGLKWYRLAADQGDVVSQANLGTIYFRGECAPRDYAEALKWYRLSADQGFVGAQYTLGELYAKGEGVPRDYVVAHMWYSLAAAQAERGGGDLSKSAQAKYTFPANSNQYRFNNEFISNQKLLTLHSIASFDLQLSVAPRPHGEPPQSG